MSNGGGTADRSSLRPLGESTSRSDLVVEALREAILTGTLEPGEVLVERRLAETLGVSKTPVREALITLSRTGLVITNRNRGVSIRSMSIDEARQVYEERLLLEPWAVSSAVRRGTGFADAIAIMAELRRVRSDADAVGLVVLNRRFHRALFAGCPNHFVLDTLDGLQDLTAFATVSVTWERSHTWKLERDEHAAILDACRDGDADGAAELMRRHIADAIGRFASTG